MANQRGFKNVDIMNQYIIDGISSKSTDDDILYCLGDLFGKEVMIISKKL